MNSPQTEPHAAVLPPRAHFRPAQLALWIPLCLVHGGATAWLAFGIQKRFAPLGLFPILLGLAMGITLAGLMRLVHVAGRSTIVAGTVVAVTVAVFGQHYFSYQEQRQEAERQAAQFRMAARAHPDIVRGAPPVPANGAFEFLRWQAIRGRPITGTIVARGGWAWASWALDGGLVLLAALLVVIPAARQPYCDRCRTWYSTVRRGAVSLDAAAAVATELGFTAPEEALSAVFRVVQCQGGCGVVGFEICWEMPKVAPNVKRFWISSEQRSRLEELLHPESAAPSENTKRVTKH